MSTRKTVFLDRDGVINMGKKSIFVNDVDDFVFIPRAIEAIALFTENDFRVIIVTNQGGIGAGYTTLSKVNAIHDHMKTEVALGDGHIDGIYLCEHAPDAGCDCRKPKPGMLIRASKEHNIDTDNAFMVGDYTTDIQAAHAYGIESCLVRTGRGLSCYRKVMNKFPQTMIFDDLYDCADYSVANWQI